MTTSEGIYTSFPGPSTGEERALTKPSEGVKNSGFDNANSDLIMHVNDVLVSEESGRRYHVMDAVGQGTFGQVVKCWSQETQSLVAVKVIKNQEAYYHQARVEVGILRLLNERYDTERHNIVRLLDFFRFRDHLCLVFELLDTNLYELLKRNGYRGLSLQLVRFFLKQMLDCLAMLRDERIIHCDLKPENVLLRDQTSGRIKIIDFGSACLEHKTVYSYIQSRFYRSPEVVLGYPYTTAIDMWSLGCVAAELFLGLPLFPAASERDLLARLYEMLGPLPETILRSAKHCKTYFKEVEIVMDGRKKVEHELLSEEEFEAKNNAKSPSGKRYFMHSKLADIIGAYPMKSGMSEKEAQEEQDCRKCFVDFLLGILEVNAHARWTPHQAALHPFISGDRFTGPFQPPPAPDSRSHTHPVGIQDPRAPRGHSYSWHADAFQAHSATPGYFPSPAHARAHAQAHAIAMAAVQQLSPQMSPHFGSNNVPGGLGMLAGTPDNALLSPTLRPQPAPAANGGEAANGAVQQGRAEPAARPPVLPCLPPRQLSTILTGHGLSPRTFGTPPYVQSLPNSQMSPMYLDRIAAMAGAAAAAAKESVRQQLGSLTGLGPMLPEPSVDKPPPHPAPQGLLPDFSPRVVGFRLPDANCRFDTGDAVARQPAGHQPNGDASPLAVDSAQTSSWVELKMGLNLGQDSGEWDGVDCPTSRIYDDDGTTVEEYSPSPGDWDPNYSDIEFLHSPGREGALDWDVDQPGHMQHNPPIRIPLAIPDQRRNPGLLDLGSPMSSWQHQQSAAGHQVGVGVPVDGQATAENGPDAGAKSRSKRGWSSGAVLGNTQNAWGSGQGPQHFRFATNEGLPFLTSTTDSPRTSNYAPGQVPHTTQVPAWPAGTQRSRLSESRSGLSPTAEVCSWMGSPEMNTGLCMKATGGVPGDYAAAIGGAQGHNAANFVGTPTRGGHSNAVGTPRAGHLDGLQEQRLGHVRNGPHMHRPAPIHPTTGAEHTSYTWGSRDSTLGLEDPHCAVDGHEVVHGEVSMRLSQEGQVAGPVGGMVDAHRGQQHMHRSEVQRARYRANSDSFNRPPGVAVGNGKSRSMDCSSGQHRPPLNGAGGHGNWLHPPQRQKVSGSGDTGPGGSGQGDGEMHRAGNHWEQSQHDKAHGWAKPHTAGGHRGLSRVRTGRRSSGSGQMDQLTPEHRQLSSQGFIGDVRESRTGVGALQRVSGAEEIRAGNGGADFSFQP